MPLQQEQRRRSGGAPCVLALVAFAMAFVLPAHAQQSTPDPGFTAFAGARLSYDTNFFRIDNSLEGTVGLDTRGLADTMFTAYAGVDGRWRVGGRQQLVVTGEINQNVQDVYSEADYTGGNLLASLEWVAGNATYGDLTFTNLVDRVDFQNQDVPIIKFRTRNRLSGAVNRRLSTHWTIGAGAGYTETSFDAGVIRDVERQDAFLRLVYQSRRGNELRFVADAEEREGSGINNLGFTGFAVGPEIDWKLSTDLQLEGALKYQERNPEDPNLVPFDGPTGHFGVRWSPSDKVYLNASVLREISSLGDQLSNFAIINRQVLSMEWLVSRRLSYYIRGQHEQRDFELEPTLLPLPGIVPREDEIITARIGSRWDPRRRLHFEVSAELGDRSSNRQFRDFRYETYVIEFQYNFL
jgi:Putative beta-barrel porin 2